ncbi:MAG: protein kinase [Ktedonobacteraceae bacterium]
MICPRCGNEWDASRSPCTRCGLVIRLPQQSGSSGRTSATSQKSTSQPSGSSPQNGQWSRESSTSQPQKQQSGGWSPSTGTSSDSQHAADPLSGSGFGSSSNAGQSFPSSRGMSSSNSAYSAPAQQPPSTPSPFSRSGQPSNFGNGSSSVDAQQSPSPFSRGPQSGGGAPLTPQPLSSGPLSRGLQSNGEFPSFSSPSAPASSQRNTVAGGNRLQSSMTGTNGQKQEAEYSRPFQFSASTIPETPRPSPTFTSASAMDNRQWDTPLPGTDSNADQTQKPSRTDGFSSRSVPQRPHTPVRASDPLKSDIQNSQMAQSSFRASRLVTEAQTKNEQFSAGAQIQSSQKQPPFASTSPTSFSAGAQSTRMEVQPLEPGTLLRSGRYRLYEMQERQDWLSGVFEARWVAQDAQRAGSQVVIRELVLPENSSVMMQSSLRNATMALSQVGRHPHIPTLWDAFSDKGRNFFVFEPFDGESLLSRMRRTGRAMSEQDVIECCLQMTEVMELLAQQSPPLVHGLISPEHILSARNGSQYALINFSLVLAGGATQFVSGIDRTHLSSYTAPEFMRGSIDGRSDLYALMATAYHAITGSVPAGVSGSIPSAQRLNPTISPEFDAILTKGLRPVVAQRYQRPSELRQDLLAMRSVSGSLVSGAVQRPLATSATSSRTLQTQPPSAVDAATQDAFKPVAQALQSFVTADDDDEQKQLLPQPESLPPMPHSNINMATALWLGSIILGMIIVIVMSRGF